MVENAAVAPELARRSSSEDEDENKQDCTIPENGDESTAEDGEMNLADNLELVAGVAAETGDAASDDKPLEAVTKLLSDFLKHNQDCKRETILKSLKVLSKLMENLSDPRLLPLNSDKRRVRLRNPNIKEYVLEKEGAIDILFHVGFQRAIKDHEEWLVFSHGGDSRLVQNKTLKEETEMDEIVSDLNSTRNVLSGLLENLTANKKWRKNKKTVVANKKQERKEERAKELQRWKDENHLRNETINHRNRAERLREAKARQEQEKAQHFSETVYPYVMPVFFSCMALMAIENPGKIVQYAVFAFVFFWVSRFFSHWVDNGTPFAGTMKASN